MVLGKVTAVADLSASWRLINESSEPEATAAWLLYLDPGQNFLALTLRATDPIAIHHCDAVGTITDFHPVHTASSIEDAVMWLNSEVSRGRLSPRVATALPVVTTAARPNGDIRVRFVHNLLLAIDQTRVNVHAFMTKHGPVSVGLWNPNGRNRLAQLNVSFHSVVGSIYLVEYTAFTDDDYAPELAKVAFSAIQKTLRG